MIFFRKPVSTFRDHALARRLLASIAGVAAFSVCNGADEKYCWKS